MKSSIEELKLNNEVSTSEELFGIFKTPEMNCSYIDDAISEVLQLSKDIKLEISYLDIPKEDISNVEYYTEKVIDCNDKFNELRFRLERLRAWGENWKSLAKSIFEVLSEEEQKNFLNIKKH